MRVKRPSHEFGNKVAPLEDAGLVAAGIGVESIDAISNRTGLTKGTVKQLAGISEGTLARRKAKGRLSPDESDRLYRLHRVTTRVLDFFDGNKESAYRWLQTPVRGLNYQKPVDLLNSDAGATAVTSLIGRLEHGVFT